MKKKRFKDIEIMEEKEIMISSVSLKLFVLHARLSLFLIIYPYKLPGLKDYRDKDLLWTLLHYPKLKDNSNWNDFAESLFVYKH